MLAASGTASFWQLREATLPGKHFQSGGDRLAPLLSCALANLVIRHLSPAKVNFFSATG
jgi:hypothetical protein